MSIHDISQATIAFIESHPNWAVAVVFGLAFGESLAFIALFVPATVILIGVSVLIGQSAIPFLPIWTAAAVGAILGDWVSYVIGHKLDNKVAHMWPFTKKPQLLERGYRFFERWGVYSVFIGRFFGPVRAVIPLIAGIMKMPRTRFQVANVLSGLVWATGILVPGAFGVEWVRSWWGN